MSFVFIPTRFQWRKDTAANWAANNPIPLEAEPCLEIDTGRWKLGDGSTAYSSLLYSGAGAIDLAGLSDGDVLAWDEVNGKFAPVAQGGGGGSGIWTTVKKTADESRSSTTTLANDSTLLVALSASTRYRVRFDVLAEGANAIADLKVGIAYSGSLTKVRGHREALRPHDTTPVGAVTETALLATGSYTSSIAGVYWLEFDYVIETNTAGTLSFQWAQNTSDPGSVTVLAGSYLEWATF